LDKDILTEQFLKLPYLLILLKIKDNKIDFQQYLVINDNI